MSIEEEKKRRAEVYSKLGCFSQGKYEGGMFIYGEGWLDQPNNEYQRAIDCLARNVWKRRRDLMSKNDSKRRKTRMEIVSEAKDYVVEPDKQLPDIDYSQKDIAAIRLITRDLLDIAAMKGVRDSNPEMAQVILERCIGRRQTLETIGNREGLSVINAAHIALTHLVTELAPSPSTVPTV